MDTDETDCEQDHFWIQVHQKRVGLACLYPSCRVTPWLAPASHWLGDSWPQRLPSPESLGNVVGDWNSNAENSQLRFRILLAAKNKVAPNHAWRFHERQGFDSMFRQLQ